MDLDAPEALQGGTETSATFPTIDETVEKTTLAHEDYPPNMSQQLAVHWMWQCRLLVAERDAMLRSLKETQDTLHQQQVVQMEEE
ncbi:hypothetical protein HBH98_256340, partial [Parastagonospora nodorum]